MTPAQNILARAATIAMMVLTVIWLTQLFEKPAHVSTPAPHEIAEAAPSSSEEKPAVTAVNDWTGEIDFAPAYAALNPYADVSASTVATTFDPNDDYWGLPRSEGYETVAAYCSVCHTLQIVMQQRQARDGWDYLLTWMAEKQGMAEPPAETRAEILNYLSREFSD